MQARLLSLLTLLSLLLVAPPAQADAGDVLVRFRAAATADERGDARRAAKVNRKRGLPVAGLELAEPEPGVTAAAAAARLERSPGVLYAEPDAVRRALRLPNDPFFGFQWGLHNTGQSIGGLRGTADADIDAPEAWDLTVGDRSVLVAVADTGVYSAHPDLAPNVWVDAGEVAGNGLDDDGNGFVDDARGWDFVEEDATPQDADGHGTHVAGTIAASGDDGVGVAGAAWRSSLLPLRVLGADGSGSVSDLIRAYAYAGAAGADIVNLSLGGGSGSRAERDAIAAQPGVLFVTAAGNEGANNDEVGSFPCNYDLPNVVCVAASDQFDSLAEFSNHGLKTVDLAAPGVSIASTYPEPERWVYMDGTSMATPLVSGVAALLQARFPGASVADLRRALLDGADQKLSLAGTTVTGGRLNALGAIQELTPPPPPPPPEEREEAPPPSTQPSQPPPSEPSQPPPSESSPPPGGTTTPPGPDAAPAPGPPEPVDVTAPFVRFSASPSRDLAAFVRRRAMRVRLDCTEPCVARVELRRGPRLLARRTATLTGATIALRLRVGARERARLRRVRSVRLVLRVRVVDPAGNARTVSRRLTLRRR